MQFNQKTRLILLTSMMAQTTLVFSQDLNYQSFAEMRLGKDKPGLILRDLANAEWEIIAVGNSAVAPRENLSDAQVYREALLMAGAQAKKSLAEFIGGIRVTGFETRKTESQVFVDSNQKDSTREKFSDFFKSQQQQDVYAFIRGTRQVGEWTSTDGKQAFLAVAVRPRDISQSLSISQSIAGVPTGEQFKVVGTEGNDMSPRRVQAWGMAARTTDSIAASRRAAIYDALRLSVESVAGMSLSGRTSVRNLKNLKSNISSMTSGIVKSFIILKEEDSGTQYRVLIEAEVQPNLSGNTQLVLELLGNPPVAVCTSKIGQNDNWVSVSVRDGLASRGVVVQDLAIREEEYQNKITSSDQLSMTKDAAYRAVVLEKACRNGIPVVIWCERTGGVNPIKQMGSFFTVLASGNVPDKQNVQAFSTVTGERIGAVAEFDRGSFLTNSKEIVPVVVNEVMAFFEDEVFNGIRIRCELSKMASVYRQGSSLRKIIEALDNCKSVKQTGMDAEGKTLVLTVRFAGTIHEFLDALMEEAENSMDDNLKTLDVSKQEGNVVCLTF